MQALVTVMIVRLPGGVSMVCDMLTILVWERPNFYSSPSISRSLDTALDVSGLGKDDIDLFDFYSYVKNSGVIFSWREADDFEAVSQSCPKSHADISDYRPHLLQNLSHFLGD